MTTAIDHGRGFRAHVAEMVAQTRKRLNPLNKNRQSILLTPDQCPNCFNRGAKPIYGWMNFSNGRRTGKMQSECLSCGKIFTWIGAQKA